MEDNSLNIIVKLQDDASSQMADMVSSMTESVDGLTSSFASSSSAMEESFAELASIMQTDSADISEAALAVGQSFDQMAAQIASDTAIADESVETMAATTDSSTLGQKAAWVGLAVVAKQAFSAISGGVQSAITDAADWNKSSAELAQVLKDTGNSMPISQMQDFAKSMQNTTLFTQQQALESLSLIMSHKSLQSSYVEITNAAADMATKMGTDLPSATKVLTTALADPVAGVNQLIRMFGTDFSEAQVSALQKMAKTGDQAGTTALIMDTLKDSIGGMAQAADDASGTGLEKLNNETTQLATTVGEVFAPAIDKVNKVLAPLLASIGKWVEAHPKLTAGIVIVVGAIVGLLAVIASIEVAIMILTPAVVLLGAGFALLTTPVLLVIAAIMILTAVVIGIVTHWSTISKFFQGVWDDIKKIFDAGINYVKQAWENLWNDARVFVSTLWNQIEGDIQAGWDWIESIFDKSKDVLTNAWRNLWTGLGAIITDVWEGVKETIKDAINSIITLINDVINKINAVMAKAAGALHLSAPQIPDIPLLANGGIVNSATLAIIGEAGPEAVIPLSQMGSLGQNSTQGQNIVININNPSVRNNQDIESLRKMVDKALRPLLINTKIAHI